MIRTFVEYVVTTEAPQSGLTRDSRAGASREGGFGSKDQITQDYRKKKARARADHYRLKSRGFRSDQDATNAAKAHRLKLKTLRTGYMRSLRTRR